MSKIESLSDLFDLVGCQADYYDIGRHISKITPTQVMQFDLKQQPYPFTFKQQAWLAIVLTPNKKVSNKQTTNAEPIIWFVRLAVDEQGCLNLGTRDHLIKTIIDKILVKDDTTDLSDALKDNPYAFQPDHERMASFHSTLSLELGHPPSNYFHDLIHFFNSDFDKEDISWQSLGLQGIADLAVRAKDANYAPLIEKVLLNAPIPLAGALAIALEHEKPSTDYLHFVETIYPKISNIKMKVALLRSISKVAPTDNMMQSIKSSLTHSNQESDAQGTDEQLELIVVIIAKCPYWLNLDEELLHLCMENLACRDDGFLAFSQIASELSQLPMVRGTLWTLFRSEHRSQQLSKAIGSLFTKAPSQVQ